MKLQESLNFDVVINSLLVDPQIPLIRGGYDTFIEASNTRINGMLIKNAIHYRISDTNSKRVTFNLIYSIYDYYQIHGTFPSKNFLILKHMHELKSRPCNYSVALGIVKRFIEK